MNSSSIFQAKLHKRHTALSFHSIHEVVAFKYVGFYFLPGCDNPADILSKHLYHASNWGNLQCLLFWKCYCARYVAHRHLTDIHNGSVYPVFFKKLLTDIMACFCAQWTGIMVNRCANCIPRGIKIKESAYHCWTKVWTTAEPPSYPCKGILKTQN